MEAEQLLDPLLERSPLARAAYYRGLIILLLATLAIRLAFLAAKPAAVSSIDAFVWEDAGRAQYLGNNPYITRLFNWLPPLSWLAVGLFWFSLKSGITFVTLLWVFLISVELGLVAATYRLICRFVAPDIACNVLLAGIALNPAAILQTAQHASFHVVLMLYVVLCLDALIRFHRLRDPRAWKMACLWLGLAVLTKTVPLALAPLLMSGARRLPMKTLAIGAALLFGPMLVGLAIVFPSAPSVIWHGVVLYHALGGYFGIAGLLVMATADMNSPWIERYASLFAISLAVLLASLSLRFWLKPISHARSIILIAAALFVSIMTLGPGFGSQYVYWLLPTFAAVWALYVERGLRRVLLQAYIVTAITYVVCYSFLPSHGGLALHLFPQSAICYRIELYLIEPVHETLARLPMFLSCLSLAVRCVQVLMRGEETGNQIAIPAGFDVKLT